MFAFGGSSYPPSKMFKFEGSGSLPPAKETENTAPKAPAKSATPPPSPSPLIRKDESIDWTASDNPLKNYHNRLASAYLANSRHSDITFYVEQDDQSIPAHSLIVATASPELERCCYGSGDCVDANTVICVPDCSTADFFVVLRHLYSGGSGGGGDESSSPAADAVSAIGLTVANAPVVLRLADYYNLKQLDAECQRLLLGVLSVDNVCEIFDVVHLLDEHPVTEKCLKLMLSRATHILSNGTAMRMQSPAAIDMLLHSDDMWLNGGEIELFQAMCKWANAQCLEHNKQLVLPTAQARRKWLDDRLWSVRFGRMTMVEFARCLQDAGIGFFSYYEIGAIVNQITWGAQQCEEKRIENNFTSVSPEEPKPSCRILSVPRLPHVQIQTTELETMKPTAIASALLCGSVSHEWLTLYPGNTNFNYVLVSLKLRSNAVASAKDVTVMCPRTGETVECRQNGMMLQFKNALPMEAGKLWNLLLKFREKAVLHEVTTFKTLRGCGVFNANSGSTSISPKIGSTTALAAVNFKCWRY